MSKGNTWGKVSGDTPKSTVKAAAANPAVDEANNAVGTNGFPTCRVWPSLAKGPAICLEGGSGNEHNTTHKHTDRPAQRIGKNGRATGVPGTITLGQAKGIASRAIEKATGGKKGGGCDRKDIQKQLDEKFEAPDDALLRGVKDARKVSDRIKDALNAGKD